MKVNKNSWSYKLNAWIDGMDEHQAVSMDSCQYIRYTLKNICYGLWVSLLGVLSVVLVIITAGLLVAILVGYIALLLGPFVGYSEIWHNLGLYDAGSCGMIALCIVVLILSTFALFDKDIKGEKVPSYLKFKSSQKTPGVLWQHLQNIKDKVCTKVEVVDE